ncbi:TIM barrel protein [Methanococcoides seepicolus]|jgi:deoxyribonuclease-4|uniref:TIM barrel protein n=1 Tax=Methanococcoides seepicolus TaxID=2828780 RepID=A0A9E5DAY6_9EURY|nr:TIM barrel protein [Methanococcoides seepicolus]MCM1985494.1 TIM barrel protein [Methanococcoides seepicolus]
MKQLLFGTAGAPLSSKKKGSIEGIKRVREIGLDCMELEFVRGVRMKEETAANVRQTAEEENVALSVHAPYYINLNSAEAEKIEASIERIYQSARIGALCGASSIVFHPAYYQGQSSEKVMEKVTVLLEGLTSRLADEGIDVVLRPEITGKATQFGSLEETLMMASAIEGVMPCIDFSHLHARSCGEYNTMEEFRSVLESVENTLGRGGLDNMHCHVSGIAYGDKGEKNHLVLSESDLNYMDLMAVFQEFDIKGLVICESPNLEEDALLLKSTFVN